MQFVFIVCLMAVGALAAPEALLKPVIPVLERTESHNDNGEFSLFYKSGDGTEFSESGVLKPTLDGKDNVLVLQGQVSYIGDDGKVYVTKYVADENGYRPEADHLPKSVVA